MKFPVVQDVQAGEVPFCSGGEERTGGDRRGRRDEREIDGLRVNYRYRGIYTIDRWFTNYLLVLL